MKKKSIYILLTLSLLFFNSFTSKANWFTDIINAVASIWQPVWGKYDEGGCNRNPPLTTFKRGDDVYWNQRETIRSNIKLLGDTLHYTIYNAVFAL